MLWMDKKASHRCEESLNAKASLHYFTQRHDFLGIGRPNGWYLGFTEENYDYGNYYTSYTLRPIRFCPYCGEELVAKSEDFESGNLLYKEVISEKVFEFEIENCEGKGGEGEPIIYEG